MENVTVGQLDTNLPRFYAEARNKSGESYSKFSLLGFRHAFERYLNAPPLIHVATFLLGKNYHTPINIIITSIDTM